jgi:hypothetical protein
VGGNPKVEQASAETEWQLLQVDVNSPGSGQPESGYGAPVGPNAASILRRYEFYKYSGVYDPETHEALASIGESQPNDPSDPAIYNRDLVVDLGNYLGAQNGAVNLAAAAVAVPEPETCVMMLTGLGLVGAAAQRRKRAKA